MKYKPEDIFTPQGILSEVEKNPNLDFLMNIFNIPRVFGVSGFGGSWSVGKHSYAAALIALHWAKFNQFFEEKQNKLVVLALTHDLHEAVTGDILPMFKTSEVKKRLDELQSHILSSLNVTFDNALETDLKIVDLIAFLYEIHQVSPNILHPKKLALAKTFYQNQKKVLFDFCKDKKLAQKKVAEFLSLLELP